MKPTLIITPILLLTGIAAGWWLTMNLSAQPGGNPKSAPPKSIDASNYPSLQAAFDAVPETGGVVRIPPGNYKLTKPLILSRENVRIEGAGAATHLINHNKDGEPALILRPKDRAKNKRSRIWRVQLADFRVSSFPPKSPKSGDGILAEGVNEIYIHGVSVDHNGGHGINLVDCYEDPRICDSILTYNKKAGLNILRGHDIVVNGYQFEENQDALRCIDSFNLCMNGNCLDDHLRHGVVIENTYGSVLSGNMIEECKGTAIILDRDCYGITISANVIAHNFSGGVDLKDAWGCAVSANTFTIVAKRGLVVGPNSGRITITGNNFSNSWIGGKLRRQPESFAAGIELDKSSEIAITGNNFTGLKGAAIATKGGTRITVVGNVMTDLHRGGNKKGRAVEATSGGGAVPWVIVENNVIEQQFRKGN